MDFRDELIQVAAVAVAMVEDLDYGEANFTVDGKGMARHRGHDVLRDVANERIRQDAKWGPQHHGPAEWLVILMEEIGEAAQAALKESIFPKEERAASLRVGPCAGWELTGRHDPGCIGGHPPQLATSEYGGGEE